MKYKVALQVGKICMEEVEADSPMGAIKLAMDKYPGYLFCSIQDERGFLDISGAEICKSCKHNPNLKPLVVKL